MASIGNIAFACDDPRKTAELWAAALRCEIQEARPDFTEALLAAGRDPNGAAAAVDSKGRPPRPFFIKARRRRETTGRSLPIHLDLVVRERDAEVPRSIALGAALVETRTRQTGPHVATWSVMRDPEGNGSCVQ